jgi:hypothetical protein
MGVSGAFPEAAWAASSLEWFERLAPNSYEIKGPTPPRAATFGAFRTLFV